MRLASSLILLCAFVEQAISHTWIEQVSLIDDSGNYAGAYGYPRDFAERQGPKWDSDPEHKYNQMLVNEGQTFVAADMPICKKSQQSPAAYTDPTFPKLQAAPGSFVAMRYLENGHTTLPDVEAAKVKPPAGGTVFVFATVDPKEGEKMGDVLQWTRDGKGGDGRGKLLTAQDFDDGRCHEMGSTAIATARIAEFPNDNMPLWCETSVPLPGDLEVGKLLTLYWLWDWPSNGTGAKDEYYSSCLDFDIVEKNDFGAQAVPKFQQDPMKKAVDNYKDRKATWRSNTRKPGSLFDGKMPDGSDGNYNSDGGEGNNETPPSARSDTSSVAATQPSDPASSSPPSNSEPAASAPASSPTAEPAPSNAPAPTLGTDMIPTLGVRPGETPPPPSDSSNNGGMMTVTVKETIYVTPGATPAPSGPPLLEADPNGEVVVPPEVSEPAATAMPPGRRRVRRGRGTA